MSTIDRAALIEQAAKAIWEDSHPAPTWGGWESAPSLSQRYHLQIAAPALPVIAKALLAPVRELHYAAYQDANRNPICPDCQGKAGTHPCGCWAKYDTEPVCGVCWEGWKYMAVPYPCPTVRLLDAIEAEVQP